MDLYDETCYDRRSEESECMNFRNLNELNQGVYQMSSRIPQNLDLIVGVPRSGFLPANVLALHRNVALTDVDGLIEGRILSSGERFDTDDISEEEFEHVLVLDDSVNTGNEIQRVKEKIKSVNLNCNIEYGAVFVTESGSRLVDYYHQIVSIPRVFEWNIMHHDFLSRACVEFEGVIAEEQKVSDISDTQSAIQQADPITVPNVKLGWIITKYDERFRETIECWLVNRGISYNNLLMISKKEENQINQIIDQKVNMYSNPDIELYLVSDFKTAESLTKRTGKPVYCHSTKQILNSNSLMKQVHAGEMFVNKFSDDPIAALKSIVRFIKGKLIYIQK